MNKNRLNLRKVIAIAICLTGFSLFPSCGNDSTEEPNENNKTEEKGVEINGVIWATRNLDTPSTFTSRSEDTGMYYQWSKKIAYPINATNLDGNLPSEYYYWESTENPCPAGWRIPTIEEFDVLYDTVRVSNEWTTRNGINGVKFTDKILENSIFFPASSRINFYHGDGDENDEEHGIFTGFYWSSNGCGEDFPKHALGMGFFYIKHLNPPYSGPHPLWDTQGFKLNALTIRCVVDRN